MSEEKEFSTEMGQDDAEETQDGAENANGSDEADADDLFLDMEDSEAESVEVSSEASRAAMISADELNDALDAQARAEEKLAKAEESVARAEGILAEVRKELDAVRVERDDYKNRMVRAAADLENFRRRAQREQDDLRKYGIDKVVADLIPAVDNLERAIQHASTADDSASIVDGVKMIYRQIVSALSKYGVEGFESKGTMFDPQRHEAIQQVETTEFPSGTVMEQYQKGYFLHERLLRPALVSVAKFVGIAEDAEVPKEEATEADDAPRDEVSSETGPSENPAEEESQEGGADDADESNAP